MIPGGTRRAVLGALQTVMGLAAVVSGPALVLTNGLGMPPEWMESSPFGSYTIPGLVLLILGLANLVGVFATLRRLRWAAPVSAAAGLAWIGWFVAQVAVVGLVSWQQPVYFAAGLLILALSIHPLSERLRRRASFRRRTPSA